MRNARRLLRAVLMGGVVAAIVAPASAALADPSLSSIQHQIDVKSAALESVVEQFNKLTEQLKADQAAQVQLQNQLTAQQASVNDAASDVSQIAAAAYMGGGPLSKFEAILESGTPQGLVDQLNSLDQLARERQTAVTRYTQATAKFTADKRKLDQTVSAEQAKRTQLAAQRNQINAQLANLYALRKKAFGSPTVKVGTGASTKAAPYFPGKAGIVVKFAYAQLGAPYEFGEAGPYRVGYDCSGLTLAAWARAGVSLYHNAAVQWTEVTHISRSALQPGDLVFYRSLGHVAIYIGGGKVIHAPSAGDVVKISSVDMMTPYGFGRPH